MSIIRLTNTANKRNNLCLLKYFQNQLTYLLQVVGFLLRTLQGPETMFGQHDRTVQTLEAPLTSLLAHQGNKLLCQLMLGTEEAVFSLFSELDLATPL